MVHIYNGMILSQKKGWNTANRDSMDGYWEYHGKQSWSNEEVQEPCDFTHMYDMYDKKQQMNK